MGIHYCLQLSDALGRRVPWIELTASWRLQCTNLPVAEVPLSLKEETDLNQQVGIWTGGEAKGVGSFSGSGVLSSIVTRLFRS